MPHHIVYMPAERPECGALVDGRWVPAEIRMWVQHHDDTWTADVGYATAPTENRIGTFPADELRSPRSVASMDFQMTNGDTLGTAVLRLREAGYVDASSGAERVGDPTHVLSVGVDDASAREDVWRIIREADPGARAL